MLSQPSAASRTISGAPPDRPPVRSAPPSCRYPPEIPAPAEHSPAPDTFHWCYCNGRIAYLLISVSVQDSIRDMAVTAVFRVPFQMVLMLLSAPDIICQRQHFQHDLVPVLPAVYKSSCFFQMSGICTVQPCPVLFSNVHALFVQAVGSMISNRCAISSEMLVFFSS